MAQAAGSKQDKANTERERLVGQVLWLTRDLDHEGQAIALVEYGVCSTLDEAREVLAALVKRASS